MERKVTISGHGNVQALRTLWSAKSHEDEQTKQQKSSTPRPLTERQEKQIPKTNTSTLKLNNEKPTTPILDEISPKQSIDKGKIFNYKHFSFILYFKSFNKNELKTSILF